MKQKPVAPQATSCSPTGYVLAEPVAHRAPSCSPTGHTGAPEKGRACSLTGHTSELYQDGGGGVFLSEPTEQAFAVVRKGVVVRLGVRSDRRVEGSMSNRLPVLATKIVGNQSAPRAEFPGL